MKSNRSTNKTLVDDKSPEEQQPMLLPGDFENTNAYVSAAKINATVESEGALKDSKLLTQNVIEESKEEDEEDCADEELREFA